MKTLVPYSFAVLFVSCFGGLIAIKTFQSRLRRLHTATWEQLGKPGVFLNNSPLNSIRFLRFMWRKDYKSLPDKNTVTFGRMLRAFLIFYAILFPVILYVLCASLPPRK